ncbi:MAG: phosphate ABC transporter permease family protein, partial [Rhodobacteraceae bacterium]|nr:phosphate ABC transporter permease family protein [Paracoccaceae bacterium]
MPILWLIIIVLAIALVGYVAGRRRALASAGGNTRNLHSLPIYYGMNVFLTTMIPALGLLALWLILQPIFIQSQVADLIPESIASTSGEMSLTMSEVGRVADGIDAAIEQGLIDETVAQDPGL